MARSSIIVDPRNLHVRPGEPADSPALRQIFLRARSLSWTWLPAAAWRLEDFDAATADEHILDVKPNDHRWNIPEAVEADEPAGVISVVLGFALMMALDVAL